MKKEDKISRALFLEIANFKGKFEEINSSMSVEFPVEKTIGTMTDLEKTVFTLSFQKIREYNKLIEEICGKNPEKMTKDEKSHYDKIILAKRTEAQFQKHEELMKQYHFLKNLVMTLIVSRLEENELNSPMTIREGWKIVICPLDKMVKLANEARMIEHALNHTGPKGEA